MVIFSVVLCLWEKLKRIINMFILENQRIFWFLALLSVLKSTVLYFALGNVCLIKEVSLFRDVTENVIHCNPV